jgi:hypothetical protein
MKPLFASPSQRAAADEFAQLLLHVSPQLVPGIGKTREKRLEILGDREVQQPCFRLPPVVDDLLELSRRERGRGLKAIAAPGCRIPAKPRGKRLAASGRVFEVAENGGGRRRNTSGSPRRALYLFP